MQAMVRKGALLMAALLWGLGATAETASAQALEMLTADSPINLLSNGGFESGKPAYWEAEGAGATWSSDEARTPAYSLKLSGAGEAAWVQGEAVRNWVSQIIGNQEIIVGGWVRTEGVNTNPASDAEKFQLLFEFFDGQGADLLGGPVVIDLPQAEASTDGWVKLDNTSLGALTLPAAAPSVRVTFRKGAQATGAAYLDDLFLANASEGGDWPGGWFNPNVDAGDTWYYWWDGFDQGREDWPENQAFVQTVTTEAAHTGTHSLKMVEPVSRPSLEGVAISERVAVEPGEPLLVSFWVKTEGVVYPDSMGISDYNLGMTALWYTNLEGGAAGYGEQGGLDIRLNGEYNPQVIPLYPRQQETDWRQYAFVVNPPVVESGQAPVVGMELRLRYWHKFEGVTYWDDVFVAPVSAIREALPNLLSNGGFESGKPAYWEAEGAGATWSSDEARTPAYSLKLSGAGEAAWVQGEAVRNWVSQIIGNQEIIVGGWVRTEGVNTNPASDAEKFQLLFEFFDGQGADLLGGPVVIDLPQAEASTDGWVKLDNTSLGALTLPAAAPSVRVTFRKGAQATGAAYLDDLFLANASEGGDWPGGWFNPNVDAGDTWYYWWDGFDQGREDWPENQAFVQTVTTEAAHTGTHSLKMVEPVSRPSLEGVAISERVAVEPGEPLLVSFWVKTEGVVYPDSMGISDYNLGMTALWYTNLEGGAAGYGEQGGLDIRLNGEYNPQVIPLYPRQQETDWRQYAFVVNPPVVESGQAPVVGMELRLRYWHKFEGVTYWDDVFITPLGGSALVGTGVEAPPAPGDDEVPARFALRQNYPNPFNPATNITFDLPAAERVTLEVYNLLGQRVATLVDGQRFSAGTYTVPFDGSALSSGVYLYVLRTANRAETRSMVLLK